ncbi:MAG TPA: serine hydrolase [Aggregatilineales bacterium]|nr:serine hydrolase [Aggregatilineales bacterium]
MRTHAGRPPVIKWLGLAMLLGGIFGSTSPVNLQSESGAASTPPVYWPTRGWQTSTPEQQGMDSAKLAAMLDEIHEKGLPLHGMLIVRNGYVVLETYSYPFQGESRHWVASITKSVTSALIGIAIDKGYIDGVEHKLLNFFPDRTIANVDPQKRSITLGHVLSMASGLDWPTHGPQEDLWGPYSRSKDKVQYVLDRPVVYTQGTFFAYNSGGAHLLSAIVQKTTVLSTRDFAQKNLFAPLGISDIYWLSDEAGINWGEGGLALIPRDLAKFGYLYLNNGLWDGQSVVSEAWVRASTTPHIETRNPGYGLSPQYGYQWWVDADGAYKATGAAGQRLFVIPSQALVVVFVGGASSLDSDIVPETLLTSFILPAIKSTTPLPANREQYAGLESRVRTRAVPDPRPVPPLPAVARQISGKTYNVSYNSLGIDAFALDFSGDQASVKVFMGGKSQDARIGLDNVYRTTTLQPSGALLALRGYWLDSKTFVLSIFQGNGSTTEVHLVFEDKHVAGKIYIPLGVDETISGTLQE